MAPRPIKLRRRPFVAGVAGLVASQALAFPTIAAPDTAAAEDVVRDLVAEVVRLVGEGSDAAATTARLIPVLEGHTDIELLGRLVLGRHWRTATPEQRAEYDALFRDYMLQTLVDRMRPYIGNEMDAVDEAFTIKKSQPLNQRDVLVRSTVAPSSGPSIEVDWRLREGRDRLVIIDLVVEGISMLVTHRSEFGAVLDRGGMDSLLAELRGRLTESI